MSALFRIFQRLLLLLLLGLIGCYRWIISPVLHTIAGPGMGCRYTPSCSRYAQQALHQHGPFRGALLSCKRICRCHPWGGYGWDPVPSATPTTVSKEKGARSLPLHRHHG